MTPPKTSLEDRILQLAIQDPDTLPQFPDDKSDLPSDFEYIPDNYEEEEVIENITESDLIQYLDQQEHPLSVVRRLFYHELNSSESQKKSSEWRLQYLSPEKLEELYGKGWTEIEGLIDLETLKSAHNAAKDLLQKGLFQSPQTTKETSDDPFRDIKARDDIIIWLDSIKKNTSLPTHLLASFDKIMSFIDGPLYDDLSEMIQLSNLKEFQLSYYHKNGAHYDVHRDALPTDDTTNKDQRRITLVIHLTPGWSSGDGGELNIKRHLDKHGLPEGADITLKPQLGKMFLCMSGATDYEILPTKQEMFTLTCWLR